MFDQILAMARGGKFSKDHQMYENAELHRCKLRNDKGPIRILHVGSLTGTWVTDMARSAISLPDYLFF